MSDTHSEMLRQLAIGTPALAVRLNNAADKLDRLRAELAAKDARIEEQNAIIHGMQDGALVRDQAARIAELEKYADSAENDLMACDVATEKMLRTRNEENETLRKRVAALERYKRIATTYHEYAEVLARAEQAEAKVASGMSWGGFNLFGDSKSIDEAKRLLHEAGRAEQLAILIKDERARAERAKAERDAIREAGTAALKDLEYFSRREGPGGDASRFASIYKLRAALAPSPAGDKTMKMKTAEELKTVPFEMYARVLDRAVKAEAERDAAKAHVVDLEEIVKGVHFLRKQAEAERDAMREALEPFARYYELNDCEERYRKCRDDAIEVPIADLRKARAALAPASTGGGADR